MLGSDPPLHWESWHRIKGWYKAATDRAPPPARVTLNRIAEERVELYSHVPLLGTNILISVQPFPVDDSVPTEYEIEWAVTQLHNHRSGGGVGDEGRTPEEVAGDSAKVREGYGDDDGKGKGGDKGE